MLRLASVVLGLALLAGCGATAGGGPRPPEGAPYIRGTVTDVSLAAPASGDSTGIATVLIDSHDGGNQAALTVTGDTPIWETFGGGLERSRSTRLAKGQTVSAWVSGPVAESSPVQATADAIVITVE